MIRPGSGCRKLFASTLAALALAVASSGSASAKTPDAVPDWVRSAAAQHLPTYSDRTGAVVLLDDTTLTVGVDGRATAHHRRAIKILRPRGRDEGRIFIPFDGDSRITNLHVWSIGPDGHEYALKDKEIGEVGFPGQGSLYEDLHARIADAPGRDPGGVIAFEYERRSRPYVNETTWHFQEDIPAISESFTLELPPGFTYGSVWAHHQAAKVVELEHDRFRWQVESVPAIDLEEVAFSPAGESLAGRLTVFYAGPGVATPVSDTWKSVGQWYRSLSADRLTASPEIAAKAHELAGSSTDFYTRVEPIAEFVQQQVRYFVVEMGIGGYQPHPAADIFRNRYGDCKDKATLLASMLSSVGVHAALMMVDSERGVIDPDAPSIVGNHMIAAIEVPAGYTSPKLRSVVTLASGKRYLIFDPTWEKTPFGQLEYELQGSYGVLMEGDQSQIVALPVLAPELNSIHRTASFHLTAEGVLNGTVTETRFGDSARERRYFYNRADAHEQQQFLDSLLRRDLLSFSVSGFKQENLGALNQDLTTTYVLSADHFARNAGPLLMLRPRVLGQESLRPDTHTLAGPRSIPINLTETQIARDDFDIELPAGYTADELPDPVKLDLGFAAYESSTTLSGNTLHFARTYTVREVTLPASRYAEVQQLASAIAVDEDSHAILKKKL